MNLTSTREGIGIAIDALRGNKVRAALTTLGIVIGVASTMTMVAAITGFQSMVTEGLDAIGPNNFIVSRFDKTEIRLVNNGSQRAPWEGKPALTFADAEMIAALPSVRSVTTSADARGDARAGARAVTGVSMLGRSADWVNYTKGDFTEGNNFLSADDERGTRTLVMAPDLAEQLFPGSSAVGRVVRLKGEEFRVVGVYKMKENIFAEAQKNWVVVPTVAAIRDLRANADWMDFLVVPEDGYTQAQAMDDVTASMRGARRLRPAEDNNFALMKQEAFKATFDRITFAIRMVLLVLSSIGLMVGGVGVVGIMMISVTERTREIGVRKSLGATPREILWQFLVESMTVTVIGGAIGLAVALSLAAVITAVTPVKAIIPIPYIFLSIGVAGGAGILFGLYPAYKAARLDPVEALRYE